MKEDVANKRSSTAVDRIKRNDGLNAPWLERKFDERETQQENVNNHHNSNNQQQAFPFRPRCCFPLSIYRSFRWTTPKDIRFSLSRVPMSRVRNFVEASKKATKI
jgi:hypothetical protein